MKKSLFLVFVVLAILSMPVYGMSDDKEESATPQEVIQKVKEAAEFLAEKGEAGLEEFKKMDGPWVFKDTYVFVFDCEGEHALVAHIMPQIVGKDLNTLKSPDGTNIGTALCGTVQKNPNGSWVEYTWPRVVKGEKEFSRKLTYMKNVPGQPYEVGAGIYDEDISMEKLENMID